MCIGSGSRFDRVAPTDKRVDFECVIKIAGKSYDLSSWLVVHTLQCPVIFLYGKNVLNRNHASIL